MASGLLQTFAMTRATSLLLCTGLAACTSPPSDPQLGTGAFSKNGTNQTVTLVWAEVNDTIFGNQDVSYGGYTVAVSSDVVSGASGPTQVHCSDRRAFHSTHELGIMTPEVFSAPRHVAGSPPVPPGRATLTTGDIAIIAATFSAPPTSTIAYVNSDFEINNGTGITTGTLTIDSFETAEIIGSFTASAPDGTAITGSFTAPICAP
jgi:hypothetical protein